MKFFSVPSSIMHSYAARTRISAQIKRDDFPFPLFLAYSIETNAAKLSLTSPQAALAGPNGSWIIDRIKTFTSEERRMEIASDSIEMQRMIAFIIACSGHCPNRMTVVVKADEAALGWYENITDMDAIGRSGTRSTFRDLLYLDFSAGDRRADRQQRREAQRRRGYPE